MIPTAFDPAAPGPISLALLIQDAPGAGEVPAEPPALEAQGQAVEAQPGGSGAAGNQRQLDPAPSWVQALYSFGPFILIIVVFYFFIIGGNRRKEKERQALLSSLSRGDRVTTIGGIIGNVLDATGDEVVLKIDENNNTKLRITRSAVASVVKNGADRK